MGKERGKLNTTHTAHVFINSSKCVACWKCVDTCPEQAIGKMKVLWHKHIVFRKPENCSGCIKSV